MTQHFQASLTHHQSQYYAWLLTRRAAGYTVESLASTLVNAKVDHKSDFNYGEFATIKSRAGLSSYKICAKEWVEKTTAIGLHASAASEYAQEN